MTPSFSVESVSLKAEERGRFRLVPVSRSIDAPATNCTLWRLAEVAKRQRRWLGPWTLYEGGWWIRAWHWADAPAWPAKYETVKLEDAA